MGGVQAHLGGRELIMLYLLAYPRLEAKSDQASATSISRFPGFVRNLDVEVFLYCRELAPRPRGKPR